MKNSIKKSPTTPADFLKKVGLALGIIIVFNLFVHLGLTLFYEKPLLEDYCSTEEYATEGEVNTKEGCQKIGGIWHEQSGPEPYWCDERGNNEYIFEDGRSKIISREKECYKSFNEDSTRHQGNGFIIIFAVFTIVIVVGMFVRQSKSVSSGFIYGSLILLISGIIRYWAGVEDYWKFAMLGVALAVLTYLGFKYMGEKEDEEENDPEEKINEVDKKREEEKMMNLDNVGSKSEEKK